MTHELIFNALPQPATLIDADGIIVDVNPAFLDMARKLGIALRKEDRVGCSVERLTSTVERQQAMADFVQALLRLSRCHPAVRPP